MLYRAHCWASINSKQIFLQKKKSPSIAKIDWFGVFTVVWLGFHFRNGNELFKIYQSQLKKLCGTTAIQFLTTKIIMFARCEALRFPPRYKMLKIGVSIFHDGLIYRVSVITNISASFRSGSSDLS